MASSKSLLKKIIKISGRASKIDPNRHMKNIVSRNYLQDSLLFMEKYDVLCRHESISIRSYRAKALVDLGMSLECSLKSTMISAGPLTELAIDAYKLCLKKGHNLDKLFQECQSRCVGRIKLPKVKPAVFDDLSALNVGSRYTQDIWTLISNSTQADRVIGLDLISRTIDSEDWAKEVRNNCAIFYNIARKAFTKYMSSHGPIAGNELPQIEAQIRTFLSTT